MFAQFPSALCLRVFYVFFYKNLLYFIGVMLFLFYFLWWESWIFLEDHFSGHFFWLGRKMQLPDIVIMSSVFCCYRFFSHMVLCCIPLSQLNSSVSPKQTTSRRISAASHVFPIPLLTTAVKEHGLCSKVGSSFSTSK